MAFAPLPKGLTPKQQYWFRVLRARGVTRYRAEERAKQPRVANLKPRAL